MQGAATNNPLEVAVIEDPGSHPVAEHPRNAANER
jgi:hypothetical protein